MILEYADFGGAGRPPLVVLHGLLGSSRNWQTVGRALAEHFHVLAPDARNHGRSPHAEESGYVAMMEDVRVWMDAQGLARATVIGHSMGGKTAMRFACAYPERVERLVVVDSAPRDYKWPGRAQEFAALQALPLAGLTSRLVAEEWLAADVPDLGHRKFLLTNLVRDEAGGWRWQANLAALAAALPELAANNLGETARYGGPTLFVAGGRSNYIRPGDEATIRRYFPAARVETIVEAGHNPHMEQREAFLATVTAWLAEAGQ